MKKINIKGDPNNKISCSSEIIISNLNCGLKNIELFDDSGDVIVYDCLAKRHGYNTNHIICPYETSIPNIIKRNASNSILIGVSNQNQAFFINGGYPKELTDVCLLGVDSNFWSPQPIQNKNNKKFIFGMMCDSNTRAAYDELIIAFASVFKNNSNVLLYIKDRWATDTFKNYIKEYAQRENVNIIHDDEHITDKKLEREIYNNIDCHVFLNRSSTFALTVLQGMAMQKPTIVMDYSGPRDYCNELNSCLVKYNLEQISQFEILKMEEKGYRNYLFSHSSFFDDNIEPKWANPNINHLKECLIKIYDDKEYRENIAYQGRATAETLTWELSALKLCYIVNK